MATGGYGTYGARLGRDVREHCGPPPAGLLDLEAWLDRELDVALVILEPCQLVPGCRGFARYVGAPDCRGVVILPAGGAHPAYWGLHEAGHLLAGAGGHSLDTPRWRMLPEERAADDFAACCLIDGAELLEELLTGWTLGEVAVVHDAPVAAVARRVVLAAREGVAGARRFDRYLERPV